MNKTLLRISAQMLSEAAERLGAGGGLDVRILNTPANMRFVKDMRAASEDPDEDILTLESDGGEFIYVTDWEVMDYCAKLLGEA